MRQSIQNRIQEIDKFFELNFDKPYVFNFENGRIKLKKLLMYEPEIITEIDDENIFMFLNIYLFIIIKLKYKNNEVDANQKLSCSNFYERNR